MRVVLRMAFIVLVAWLGQAWLVESVPPALPHAFLADGQWLVILIVSGGSVLGCLTGALGVGFRWLLLGVIGAVVLACTAFISDRYPSWLPGVPAWCVLLAFFVLVVLHALLAAKRSTFKSGALRIRDGGDHLSVGKDGGEMTVFRQGRTLCLQSAETRSETRYGGGTYTVPTTSTIMTYGPNGMGYGTVSGSQTVSTPVFSYETSVRTSRTRFRLEEVGPDHALLTASHPKHVRIHARHAIHHREKSAHFTLGRWATFRFHLWRRNHDKAFFRKDSALPRRIAKAASAHLAQMKQRFGRTRAYELTMDHDLHLVSFVGLARDEMFVCLFEPAASLTIGKQDAHKYWVNDAIRIPGAAQAIQPGSRIRATISEWAQLAILRRDHGK